MTKICNDHIRNLIADKSVNVYYSSKEYLPYTRSETKNFITERPLTLLVIPELNGERPSPCSYIRLLDPLMSRVIQENYQIRFGTVESALTISAEVVIVNRVPCSTVADLEEFLKYVRQSNAKLIYEIDDNLLNLDAKHPEKALYKEKEAVVSRLLAEADMVWTSTNALAESIQPLCKRVYVFENYLDSHLLEVESVPLPASSVFKILYMGTKTHSADLQLVMDALRKLHSEGVQFELHLVGISTLIPNESWIKAINPPVSTYPLFMQWLRSLPRYDLGIAPLQSSHFNECKSPIKYWDYTSLGIPTVASNYGAYKNIIVDSETGFLANNNTNDWYEKLRTAINNKNELTKIVAAARTTLKNLYAQINGAERRKEALRELLKD